jgi:hypothetical protein
VKGGGLTSWQRRDIYARSESEEDRDEDEEEDVFEGDHLFHRFFCKISAHRFLDDFPLDDGGDEDIGGRGGKVEDEEEEVG